MPPPDEQRTDSAPTPETVPTRHAGSAPGAAVPPAEPATQRRVVAALFLALLSLAGLLSLNYLQRGIYLVAYALLAGLMAMWLAVTSLARARRSRTARPRGSVTATVIAGVGIVMSVIMLVAFVLLGKQLAAYGRCLSEASTPGDRQSCQSQFTRAVDHEISVLRAHGS